MPECLVQSCGQSQFREELHSFMQNNVLTKEFHLLNETFPPSLVTYGLEQVEQCPSLPPSEYSQCSEQEEFYLLNKDNVVQSAGVFSSSPSPLPSNGGGFDSACVLRVHLSRTDPSQRFFFSVSSAAPSVLFAGSEDTSLFQLRPDQRY